MGIQTKNNAKPSLKRIKRRLFISGGLLLLSLALMVRILFAWFHFSTDNLLDPFVVTVADRHIKDAEIETFAVDAVTHGTLGNTYSLANPHVFLDVLPIYDPEGLQVSTYAKALLVMFSFTLAEDMQIRITAKATQPFTADIYENYLSNAVQFFAVTDYSADTVSTGKNALSFVDTSLVVDESTYGLKETSLLLFEGMLSAGEHAVYLMLEYHVEALEFLYMQGMSMLVTDEEFVTEFTNDIRFVISA